MQFRKYCRLDFLLSILYLICQNTFAASVPVSWVPDTRFICGKQYGNLGTFQYIPSSTTGYISDLVSVSYASSLTAAPTRSVALGIADFNFKLTNTTLDFYMIIYSKSDTGFVTNIAGNTQTNLKNLKLSYITVDPSFTNLFGINYFYPNIATTGPFSLSYLVNFTAATGFTLNMSHTNGMLAFQHIMYATSSSSCFHIDIVFQLYNQSYYQVIVSTNCSMYLDSFAFSRIIFDKTDIESMGFCYFKFGELAASNSVESSLTFTTTPFVASNFMFGMKSFYYNSTTLKFVTTMGTTTSVASTSGFKYLSFMYWSYKLRQCPGGYPLFQLATSLCHDSCPIGTFSNSTVYMCQPCYYTCYTCLSAGPCTSCSSSSNRYQSGSSCLPNSGYFDNGATNAVLCSSVLVGCQTCLNSTYCTLCNTGYLLLNNICVPCNALITNCTVCSKPLSATLCSNCILGYSPSLDNLTCTRNVCIDPYCLSCAINTSQCQACIASNGYYMAANATCYIICGDGFNVGSEECDDGNLLDGDGCNADCTLGNNNGCSATAPYRDPVNNNCTNTCPTGYFANATNYTCVSCIYTCQSCSNKYFCDTCSNSSNRILNLGQCIPLPGFYDNGSQTAQICSTPCVDCISLTACTSCITGYYLSNTSCILCSASISNCNLCQNSSACTECLPGYQVNIITNLCGLTPCAVINCLFCPYNQEFFYKQNIFK